ncbi:ureidoglycolate lyase [Achromobacter sp. HZ28]|uniref:ureidoglycolate lyase n=1 Tax=Achromobacter sp. HZ28 TaxID=2015171 RepID=UPI000B51B723|nr:ureidoglycolate lyase [Achromobacter sp. HZ28]OWT80402.1 ureidoglycolate hydrolase [Achromobacter sp. HZ34]OWT82285.1 ureidoglycolate hydrolase [Achromobacter sp. HZ28]
MDRQLVAEALDGRGFAQFGEVLENRGDTRRRDFSLQFAQENGPRLWVNRIEPCARAPIIVREMERHPHSAQSFIPMRGGRCLVVVGLSAADGALDPATIRAFVTDGSQGVSYRPDVWHFAFTAIDGSNEVAVIMGYSGRGDDTVLTSLDERIEITWPMRVEA